jgi:hypothetical protein
MALVYNIIIHPPVIAWEKTEKTFARKGLFLYNEINTLCSGAT